MDIAREDQHFDVPPVVETNLQVESICVKSWRQWFLHLLRLAPTPTRVITLNLPFEPTAVPTLWAAQFPEYGCTFEFDTARGTVRLEDLSGQVVNVMYQASLVGGDRNSADSR